MKVYYVLFSKDFNKFLFTCFSKQLIIYLENYNYLLPNYYNLNYFSYISNKINLIIKNNYFKIKILIEI